MTISSLTLENQVAAHNAAQQAINALFDLYQATGGAYNGGYLGGEFTKLSAIRNELRERLVASGQVTFNDEDFAELTTNHLNEFC